MNTCNSSKLMLLSFADSKYKKSLKRLKAETKMFPFDECVFLTEQNLPKEFLKSLKTWKYCRGYGYWRWKAYIVKEQLGKMNYGDILFWSDSGNHWNYFGLNRFKEYLEMLKNAPDDGCILVFQEPFLEKDWTKGDLFDFLGLYRDKQIFMSLQLWCGAFAIRKTPQIEELVTKWNDLHQNHFDLITDKSSSIPNLYGFVEHRHDQSTFSLLVKVSKHIEISWKETNTIYPNDWNLLEEYPIQARRLNRRDTREKIKNFFMKPYRYLLGQYLIRIEGFHFAKKFPCY